MHLTNAWKVNVTQQYIPLEDTRWDNNLTHQSRNQITRYVGLTWEHNNPCRMVYWMTSDLTFLSIVAANLGTTIRGSTRMFGLVQNNVLVAVY